MKNFYFNEKSKILFGEKQKYSTTFQTWFPKLRTNRDSRTRNENTLFYVLVVSTSGYLKEIGTCRKYRNQLKMNEKVQMILSLSYTTVREKKWKSIIL